MNRVLAIVIFMAVCCAVSMTQTQTQAPPAASQPPAPASQAGSANPAPQAPAQTASTPSETAEALARKYVDLWNSGDRAAISSFPQFVMHPRAGRVLVAPNMLARVVAAWRKSMPDLNFKIEDTIVQGDKVAMRLSFTGTYKDRLFPNTAEPTNPPRLVRGTEMLIFELHGRNLEVWEEYDELAMRVQMGGQWLSNQELAAAAAKHSSKPTPHVEIPLAPAQP